MNYSQFSQYAVGIRIYKSELNPQQFLKHAGQDTGISVHAEVSI
jgi:hypothetical protein